MAETSYELYSKRLKRSAQGDIPVAYRFDEILEPLRRQVIYIWGRALGAPNSYGMENDHWKLIHDYIAEEYGRAFLGKSTSPPIARCQQELLQADTNMVLDIIEFSFRVIDVVARGYDPYEKSRYNITGKPDAAIDLLNRRFKEHGVGYQYTSGRIVRIDSEFVHAEMIEPAIALLHEAGFKGPSDEFMNAHEHYRHGRTKDAVRDALNAFESTMKAICQDRGWSYDPAAPAKKLLSTILDNELIPKSLQNQLTQFASLMEALPTVRNKMGGHGQGLDVLDVPDYFAAHALHLAAANIVLLVRAHKEST